MSTPKTCLNETLYVTENKWRLLLVNDNRGVDGWGRPLYFAIYLSREEATKLIPLLEEFVANNTPT